MSRFILVCVLILTIHPVAHCQDAPATPIDLSDASAKSSATTQSTTQSVTSDQQTIDQGSVRAAIDRSLPYIAERGEWWIENKDCISCHRVTFTIWSHALAADHGFNVDRQRITKWADFAYEDLLAQDEKGIVTATKNVSGAAQLLNATESLTHTKQQLESRVALLKVIQSEQRENGAWSPRGQLPSQRRPAKDTQRTVTMWNTLFLESTDCDSTVIEKAREYSSQSFEPDSTEWLAVRLLTTNSNQQAAILKTLATEQNADGGWGWIRKDESDALATAQVLYALRQVHSNDVTVPSTLTNRAQFWLLQKQTKKGTWPNAGTKKNKKDHIEETATYWATCWATIALLKSLP